MESAAKPALALEALLAQDDPRGNTKPGVKDSLLRSTRLHILRQLLGRWNSRERPKVAIHRSRWIALLHASTLFVPLSIAITLIVINARQVFLGDVQSSTLTATQFAAKFSEILMQASVATIVLCVIRAQVLRDEPLPLGGLTAPYSTYNITYLWSLEFWGCLTASDIALKRRIWLATSLTLSLLLTALLGPATAVLMIPRLTTSQIGGNLFILDPVSSTFPTNIQSSDNITSSYGEVVARVVDVQKTTSSTNVVNKLGTRVLDTDIINHWDWDLLNTTTITLTSTATVPARVAQSVPYYQDHFRDEVTRWLIYDTLQPNVSVTCRQVYADGTDDLGLAHLKFVDPNGQVLDHTILMTDLLPNATNTTSVDAASSILMVNEVRHEEPAVYYLNTQAWRDPPETNSNYSALMALGHYYRDEFNQTTLQGITACTIVAEWVSVQANYSGSEQSLRYESPRSNSLQGTKPRRNVIRLSSAWLQRLTNNYVQYNPGDIGGEWANRASTVIIALALADYGPEPSRRMLYETNDQCPCLAGDCSGVPPGGGLSVNQCDALNAYLDSNGQSKLGVLYSTTNWTDPTTLQYLTVKTYVPGYGYQSTTIPVQLSLCIIAAYILVIVSYLSYSLRTGQSATSWNSIAELLMLALNSHRPQQLEATSVGANTLATFREPVSIRINAEDTAELVFKNDLDVDQAKYRKAAVNTGY